MHATQVVMFPGLGATYPRMVDKYLQAYPHDAEAVARWSNLVGTPLDGTPCIDARGSERARQFEIHALNLLWWRKRAGQAGQVALCGHSLGYYAALVAAGVVGEDDSFRLIDTVFEAGWRAFADCDDPVFVVTTKDDVDFEALLAGIGVEVLGQNSPLQRVLHGPRETVGQVRERLGGQLLALSEIGARVPFHSRRLRPLRDEVAASIEALGIRARPLRAPLWSHISARPIRDGAEALALVPDQLYQPVRWSQLIDALIQSGRYELMEVGPNRVLSQLARWISSRLDVSFSDHLRRQGWAV